MTRAPFAFVAFLWRRRTTASGELQVICVRVGAEKTSNDAGNRRLKWIMEQAKKRPTEAWLGRGIEQCGMGYVIVARFKADGEAEAGVFLLDMKCLGVKDAFLSRLSGAEYQTRLVDQIRGHSGLDPISPACARRLVEDAVAYGRRFGFEPHADFRMAQRVFGGINPAEAERTFTFGDNGKPMYIQGPNDSPEFAAQVTAQLLRHCGRDGFNFVLARGDMLGSDEPEGRF